LEAVVAARGRLRRWSGRTTLGVPCFVYGPERSLPDVGGALHHLGRRHTGRPHHTHAGASGGRPGCAHRYNVDRRPVPTGRPWRPRGWLWPGVLAGHCEARSAHPRTGRDGAAQSAARVDHRSCHLTDISDAVEAGAGGGVHLDRGELVGLLPSPPCPPFRVDLDGPAPAWRPRNSIESGLGPVGATVRRYSPPRRCQSLRRRSPPECIARLTRRRRRQARTDRQIPNFSPLASAYSRQSRARPPRQHLLRSRVTHPVQEREVRTTPCSSLCLPCPFLGHTSRHHVHPPDLPPSSMRLPARAA